MIVFLTFIPEKNLNFVAKIKVVVYNKFSLFNTLYGVLTVDKKGMSFIEIMVSIVVFVICIGAIMALVKQSTETSSSVYYTYLATNLAKNRIEWLREYRVSKGYPALADLPSEQIDYVDIDNDDDLDFKRTTKIEYGLDSTKATVNIEYSGSDRVKSTGVELITLLFDY